MLSLKQLLNQTVINTPIELAIPTDITVDGRTAWSVVGMNYNVRRLNAAVPNVSNSTVTVELNTETGDQTFTDKDSIIFDQLQFHGIAASTSSFYVPSGKSITLINPRITAQPDLYLRLDTSNLTATVELSVEIVYELVKVTDLEMMRLLQGGA
jgi:hypothetical protein